jgi:CheY-like chemotaxis protein
MPCVLVADDSTEFAEMLRATLEQAGFDVVTAYSGPAALAAMGNHEVDAAVLDVLMPGISGDAVADRLRRLYPELPIVLMTGEAGAPMSQRRMHPCCENRSATRNSSTRSAACSTPDPHSPATRASEMTPRWITLIGETSACAVRAFVPTGDALTRLWRLTAIDHEACVRLLQLPPRESPRRWSSSAATKLHLS